MRSNRWIESLRGLKAKSTVRVFLLGVGLLLQNTSAANDSEILTLARETIEKVRYAGLISVDAKGQPRSRIVDAFAPDADFGVYVATKPNTRKVHQINHNPSVTLFYFDPENRNYVSIMGQAKVLDDEVLERKMRREADSDRIYPNFPDDYVLIYIQPTSLEGLLPGYRGDKETWMPARVEF